MTWWRAALCWVFGHVPLPATPWRADVTTNGYRCQRCRAFVEEPTP